MSTEDVLSSYGRLRVRLYDAIDVDEADKNETKKYFHVRKKIPEKCSCYGVFQLLTGDHMLISQSTSLLKTISGDNSCMFDEEYVFDNVLSSHQLSITLYRLNVLSELSLPILIGVSTIPIELIIPTSGEALPLLKWYQLYEQNSNQSVRSAIKLELFYEKLGVKLMSKLKAEILNVESYESGLAVVPTSTCEATSSSINLTSYSVDDPGIVSDNHNKDGIDENDLTTGIISHCLVLGPDFNTINESEPISPLSSYSSSIGYDSSLCIWDRFPSTDHPLNALPDQIEWFACPEGQKSFTRNALHRPNPEVSTFILSPGEDENSARSQSNEQFGVSVTFYIDSEIGNYSQECAIHDESKKKKRVLLNELWYSDDENDSAQDTESNSTNNNKKSKIWIGIQILVLTGHPYVSQLSQCLLSVYYHCIFPRLGDWEKICVANKSIASDFSPLRLNLSAEEFFVQLMYKLPIPIAGMFQISLKVHSGNEISGIQRIGDNSDEDTILFACPSVHSLPSCPYPIDSLINALGPRGMINVLCYALSECKMLFHSTSLNKLPGICEALRILLYPLRWAHIYIPIVPAPLLDLLEAPVPFLLGTHSSWLKHIPSQCLHDVIIIDCDTSCIKIGSEAQPTQFPSKIDRWLMLGLKMIMSDAAGYEDTYVSIDFTQSKNKCLDSTSKSRHIQILVLDVMVHLLYQVPDSLFYLAPNRPVFNKPLFLSQQYERDKLLGLSQWGICANNDDDAYNSSSGTSMGAFYETIIHTYAFHHFTESLCKSSYLICFLDCVQVYVKANDSNVGNIQEDLSSKNIQNHSSIDGSRGKREPVSNRLGLGLAVDIPKLNLDEIDVIAERTSPFQGGRYTSLFPLSNERNADPRKLLRTILEKYNKILHFNHEDRTIDYDAFLCSRDHVVNQVNSDNIIRSERFKNILLVFNADSFESGQKDITKITLEVISNKLAVPTEQLLAEYKEYMSAESSKHASANHSLTVRGVNTDILKGPIVQILELIISGDADKYDEPNTDCNIFETINQCKISLQNSLYRSELVRVLRQEHSFYVKDSASDVKALLSRMICLKAKSFELLSTLFNIMLEVCTDQHDYSAAFSLLEVGGLYFQVFDVSKQVCNTEFLNERIRQHPIYQSPMLWRSVIKHRIPVDTIEVIANHRKIVTPRSGSISSSLTTPRSARNTRSTTLLIGEIKNVLRIMYDLNINVERALIVIQTLVSDCNLPINTFFELQRFVGNLWSNGLGLMNKSNFNEESRNYDGNESPKSTISCDSKVVEESYATLSIQASVDRDEVEIKNQQNTDSVIQGSNVEETINSKIADVIRERNQNVSLNEVVLDETTVQGITNCISMHKQLLISGTTQGKVVIHNLENGNIVSILSHEGKCDKFGLPGVNIVQTASDSNFFISCNNELLKVWKMPVVFGGSSSSDNKDRSCSSKAKAKKWSYSNKEENSMRLAIIKSHRSSICKTSIWTDNGNNSNDYVPTNYTWFIASGDIQGDVCISRGSECGDKKLSVSTMISSSSSANNEKIKSPSNCLNSISALNFLDTHNLIAYGNSRGILTIADTNRGAVQEQYNSSHTKAINFLLPVRIHELLSASSDRMLKLWDVRMKQEKIVCFDNKYNSYAALGPITAVSVGGAVDNSLLACGSTNGVVNIWDIRYNYQKSCKQLVGHTGRVTNISWLINDEIIRTSATDGTIRFWDSLSGLCINTIHMYSNHTGLDSMYISSVNPQQEQLQLQRLQSRLLNKYYGILSAEESDDIDDEIDDEHLNNGQETLCFLGVKSFNGNKRAFKLQL